MVQSEGQQESASPVMLRVFFFPLLRHLHWVFRSPVFYKTNKHCMLFVGMVFLVIGEVNT